MEFVKREIDIVLNEKEQAKLFDASDILDELINGMKLEKVVGILNECHNETYDIVFLRRISDVLEKIAENNLIGIR